MPPARRRPRPSAFTRTLTQAFVISLIPLGTAFAQSPLFVRLTHDKTDISSWRATKEVRMTAAKGTVFEVTYIEGDRYHHLDSNWYWVLLPPDSTGTRSAGWIRGDDVEHVPPVEPAAPRNASLAPPPQAAPVLPPAPMPMPQARTATNEVAVVEPAPVKEVRTAQPIVMSDVVLNFPFGRSELTEEAKGKLASAVTIPKPNTQMVSVALEGHADWIGSEAYNEKLGLARAETVRRYLAEQLRIPTDHISVVSYGENSPVAPNTTREGRALNRRVVIKGGA